MRISEKQIGEIAGLVAEYIAHQRESFLQKAHPIPEAIQKKLQPFFPRGLLQSVTVAKGRAAEPGFYPQLRAMGIRNAPAFSDMAGITFQDVVVYVDRIPDSLLFHELVHAVQYEHLGVQGFSDRYVRGFLMGGSYEEIPLEKQAYELEARFAANPDSPFSVEGDVSERLRANRL
ncbi:MAG TPA: hypothetical protein VMU05_00585 [Dongiaceae bacterium]|nr:hypothetical protein [Dongiaceae bacterium]